MDALATILRSSLTLVEFMLFVRLILSWIDPQIGWPVTRFLIEATEPLLRPLRRAVPPLGMLDTSFLAALLLVFILQTAL